MDLPEARHWKTCCRHDSSAAIGPLLADFASSAAPCRKQRYRNQKARGLLEEAIEYEQLALMLPGPSCLDLASSAVPGYTCDALCQPQRPIDSVSSWSDSSPFFPRGVQNSEMHWDAPCKEWSMDKVLERCHCPRRPAASFRDCSSSGGQRRKEYCHFRMKQTAMKKPTTIFVDVCL